MQRLIGDVASRRQGPALHPLQWPSDQRRTTQYAADLGP